jgi:hypothetical protein
MWDDAVSRPRLEPDPHILLGDNETRKVGIRGGQRFPRGSLNGEVLQQCRQYQEYEVSSEGLAGTQTLA